MAIVDWAQVSPDKKKNVNDKKPFQVQQIHFCFFLTHCIRSYIIQYILLFKHFILFGCYFLQAKQLHRTCPTDSNMNYKWLTLMENA